jgi:hypothetical protein
VCALWNTIYSTRHILWYKTIAFLEMTDLFSALNEVGLGHCFSTLEEDDIDFDCLLLLTKEDVDELALSESEKVKILDLIVSLCAKRDFLVGKEENLTEKKQEVNDFLFDDEEGDVSIMYADRHQQNGSEAVESNKHNKYNVDSLVTSARVGATQHMSYMGQVDVDSKLFEATNEDVNNAFVKVFNDTSMTSLPRLSVESVSNNTLVKQSSGSGSSSQSTEEYVSNTSIVVSKELVPRRDSQSLDMSRRMSKGVQSRPLEVGMEDSSAQNSISAIHRLSPPPPPLASPSAILEVTTSLGQDESLSFESWLASQETKYNVNPKGRVPRHQFRNYAKQRRKMGGTSHVSLPSLNSLNNITHELKASYSEPRINVAVWGFNEMEKRSPKREALQDGRVVAAYGAVIVSNRYRIHEFDRYNQSVDVSRLTQVRARQRGLPPRALNGNWASKQSSVNIIRRPPPPSQLPKLTLSKPAPNY